MMWASECVFVLNGQGNNRCDGSSSKNEHNRKFDTNHDRMINKENVRVVSLAINAKYVGVRTSLKRMALGAMIFILK